MLPILFLRRILIFLGAQPSGAIVETSMRLLHRAGMPGDNARSRRNLQSKPKSYPVIDIGPDGTTSGLWSGISTKLGPRSSPELDGGR